MLDREAIIGVCGAGAMGAGIAQVAAQAGHRVIVLDQDEAALARGRQTIAESLAGQIKRGKLTEDKAAAVQQRLVWTMEIAAMVPCGLVIEAIVENAAIKQGLFRALEAVTAADAVLATNTSSLSVTDLAEGLSRPSQFLGLHFFNPAPVMKLVEVVAGAKTGRDVEVGAFALMGEWGKLPVYASDVPGFIVNRVARPFYAEGWRALEEGAADAATIDFLYRDLAGFRMGPLELGDVIGHDINYTAAKSIFDAYGGKTRFKPSPLQGQYVASEKLGKKSGRGIYDYAPGAPKPEVRYAETAEPLGDGGIIFMQSDGRSAKMVAATLAKPVVVFDFPAPAATTFAFAASSDTARRAAIGCAARLGKKAVEIADRPGLIVFRTLLQIANAAADAATDKVATPEAIDLALQNGVNYPFGVLQWASQTGHAQIAAALKAIADETDEAMYRPSAYFAEE
jgi:3-hydroxybutyryl-CoA dehydrogenase